MEGRRRLGDLGVAVECIIVVVLVEFNFDLVIGFRIDTQRNRADSHANIQKSCRSGRKKSSLYDARGNCGMASFATQEGYTVSTRQATSPLCSDIGSPHDTADMRVRPMTMIADIFEGLR